MVALSLLILTLFVVMTLGRPSPQPALQSVPNRRGLVPSAFRLSGEQPALIKFHKQFILGLGQRDPKGLHQAIVDVSDPSSSRYGQHLSKGDVNQFVAPKPESLQAVTKWLKANNISAELYSSAGDMLSVQLSLDQANRLFNANFSAYVHGASNTTLFRTLSYSVPTDVAEHLAFVYPTTQFIPPPTRKPVVRAIDYLPTTKRAGHKRTDVPGAVPEAIYNIASTPASAAGNSLAVSRFADEVANSDDLKDFLSQARPDITNGTFAVQPIDGGSDNGPGTIEASLDIQYTVGVATNVPTTFISVGEQTQDGTLSGFLDIINSLLTQDNPPLVLTTSFGFDETPFAEEAPELAQTLCNAYAQLGARGTSVLFASGDGGVSGAQTDPSCDGSTFIPTFPATCPYVTAVGSTQGINPETAADAVGSYLQTLGSTNAGLFNTTGRAYPDVSAQGVQFVIEANGQLQGVDGTSASSPTFASIIALLNDQLLNAGKTPLGFPNPLLYSKGVAALNDNTSGSNPGCGTQGFPATTGWDAVTGLGTPDFQKLLALVNGGAEAAISPPTAERTKHGTSVNVPTQDSSHKRQIELRPGPGFAEILRFASTVPASAVLPTAV
ncbi:subtilisin-like protein [Pilatotrama ljubarskyi]|nr:subtilisin-like protein [Pilatotrama ljubarskyi]